VVGSIAVIAVAPQFGISHDLHEGALKGMFSHKNLLGRQMAFGILTLLIGKPAQIPKWLCYGCLVAAFGLLLLSRSAGALITLAIVLGFYGLLRLPRKSRRSSTAPLWVGLLPLLVGLVILAITNADIFLEPLGRDTTLTGRVPLWVAIGQAIGEDPWLGHGYAIFWVHTSGSLLAVVATGWNALSAQNGYLDLCLDLGLIGLALFLWSLVHSMKLGLKHVHSTFVRSSAWPLVFLVFFTLQNFHESDLLRLGTFMWIPFVATYVSLALSERKAFLQAVPPAEEIEAGLPAFGA
jgi:exopolysaccharide production protein ExoQ